jgi:LysR substrate binding domain
VLSCAGLSRASRLGWHRGSPSYLEKHGIPATPDALLSRPCLHRKYPTSGKLQRWPFARCGPYADLRLPVTAVVTTIAPLVSLAELGIGLACVPDFAVHGQIASGSLVKVLDEYVEHSGVFRAMWPASQHSSPKLRAFVDYMAENLFPKGFSQDDRRAEAPQRIADRDHSTRGFEAARRIEHPECVTKQDDPEQAPLTAPNPRPLSAW